MKQIIKKILSLMLLSKSIKKQILISYVFIIIVLIIPSVVAIATSFRHSFLYDSIITNVNNANNLSLVVKTQVSDEIWEIVAGNKTFEEGNQYKILTDIDEKIDFIHSQTTTQKNRQVLEVVKRALKTLKKYVDLLGTQIENNASVAQNEQVLEEIRSVAALIYDLFQDFIVSEIQTAAETNEKIKQSINIISLLIFVLLILVSIFAFTAQRMLSDNIRRPIQKLEDFSNLIAEGKLFSRISNTSLAELENLTNNLNFMAEKIQDLLEENIQEQKNLQKSEMKALQAQITPHFLYNTFDSIIWLAESGKTKEVIEITRAFSSFFRISLSKGHEWICVEQEIEHVKNYLTIQKIRYRDILDYTIECDDELKNKMVLKLILQPLVENALYHGIKNRRCRGSLVVKCFLQQNEMHFSVCDNGIGMKEEKLQEILSEMNSNSNIEESKAVYGLYNVNKRLKLYYGPKSCLQIKSEYKVGTEVSFCVPLGQES